MELEKDTDKEKEKEYMKIGYERLMFVILRNGGMMMGERDGTGSWKNALSRNYTFIHNVGYAGLLPILCFSIYMERKNVEKALEAVHWVVMILSLLCGNVDFLYYRKDLNKIFSVVGRGFFKYEEKEPELYDQMKKANVKEIYLMTRLGLCLYYLQTAYIVIGQPYIYYLVMKDEPIDKEKITQNPFLPIPMYFPWDTFTSEGFVYGYLFQLSGSIIVVNNVVANGFSYVNIMATLRGHFEILNHSVQNLESRAIERYRITYGEEPNMMEIKQGTYNDKMKKCLVYCLKQNIKHHQVLLRFEKTSRRMLRIILLFVFFNASILMGATGYLLLKNLNSTVRTAKYAVLLLLEAFHTFLYCYYGERISQESTKFFQNLYGLNWFRYGREFNSILSVIMTVTAKPLRSLTAIFNTPCSLETFNNLMSTAYSYFSLINGMKDNI